jgi:hypothetical protein
MLLEDQTYTLIVEKDETTDHHWLCTDDGKTVRKIALFLTEDSAKAFIKAYNINFTKGYTMGKMGI